MTRSLAVGLLAGLAFVLGLVIALAFMAGSLLPLIGIPLAGAGIVIVLSVLTRCRVAGS